MIFARFATIFAQYAAFRFKGVGCGMGIAGNAPTVAAVIAICGGVNDVANWVNIAVKLGKMSLHRGKFRGK